MPSIPNHALDSIDRFIDVGKEIAAAPLLALPPYRGAAADLYQIAQLLLASNENMARWLNRFRYFDLRSGDPHARFKKLVRKYGKAKAGPGLRKMKYPCGDIGRIYERNIKADIESMHPANAQAILEAHTAFETLSSADGDMVAYIYDTVVAELDKFVLDAEAALNKNDLNAAETRRLQLVVDTGELSERLVKFADELSDLVLTFAGLAHKAITLE